MDYTLSLVDGLFEMSREPTDSIFADIVLSMTIKARSFELDSKGKPVYPGEWFAFPDFGQTIYEVNTASDTDVNLAAERGKIAVAWILKAGRALSIEVSCRRSENVNDRINILVKAVDSKKQVINYTRFFEVE